MVPRKQESKKTCSRLSQTEQEIDIQLIQGQFAYHVRTYTTDVVATVMDDRHWFIQFLQQQPLYDVMRGGDFDSFANNITVHSSTPDAHAQVLLKDIVPTPAESDVTMPSFLWAVYYLLASICFWCCFEMLAVVLIGFCRHGKLTRRTFAASIDELEDIECFVCGLLVRMCAVTVFLMFVVVLLKGAPFIVLLASAIGCGYMASKVGRMYSILAYFLVILPIEQLLRYQYSIELC